MTSAIDDLTVEYVDNDVVTLKELDKVVLSKGAWCTILFKTQAWDAKTEAYKPVSYTIRRYQKTGGEFKQRSKFNISSENQAKQLLEALINWGVKPNGS